MADTTPAVRDKVQRILTDALGSIEIDRDGDFSFPVESTRVFIRVIDQENRTLVKVAAPILFDVPATPDVYKHLALHTGDYFFGAYEVYEEDDKLLIGFYHVLLGDYLDPDELMATVGAIATTADELDDEWKEKLGGRRFVDASE